MSRHEGGSHRFRLRLVILDAILRTEPAFMLPPWLMAALRVSYREAGGRWKLLAQLGKQATCPLACATAACTHLLASLQPDSKPLPATPAAQPAAPSVPGAVVSATSGSADLAGALRVLMQHGRLADAASLAAAHLQAALHSVPSVSMARTSQVCFPQALLDQLLAQLGAQPGLAAEQQRVADLCGRLRGAAAKQTAVIQQLYAH